MTIDIVWRTSRNHKSFLSTMTLTMHANPTTSNHAPSTATTAATRCDSLNLYLKPKAVGPRDTRDVMMTYADEGIVYLYDQRDFLRRMNEVEEAERQRRSAEAGRSISEQEINK